MTAAVVRTQLDHVSGLIDGFRRSAEAGMAVDLSGLDRCVETMCDAIAQLPVPARPPLREALVALLDEMNGLVAALEAQHREIAENLKGVSSRQRAVAAYGKGGAPGTSDKGPPDK